MDQKFVFIFPYRGVGGVSLLFLRLSEYIAKNFDVKIFVVDYADGFISKHLFSDRVELIEYVDHGKVYLPDHATLVFQAVTPWSIFPSLQFNHTHRFVFWHCHPYNLIPVMPGFRSFLFKNIKLLDFINHSLLLSFLRKSQRFVEIINKHNALVFMDGSNFQTACSRLKIKLNKVHYLPIPVAANCVKTSRNEIGKKNIKVAWVGRIVDFKYFILSRTVERLSAAQKKLSVSIELTIVGDGDYKSQLKQESEKFANMDILFIDHIRPSALDNFLIQQDIVVGMGTSALEGAKLGIPTILLDFDYQEVSPLYEYKWLHQEKNYNLGSQIEESNLTNNADSLSELLKNAIDNYAGLSIESYQYYFNNHSITNVAPALIEYAALSTCNYSDLADTGLLNRGMIYGLFDQLKRWRRRI